jgi:hypothetical protein
MVEVVFCAQAARLAESQNKACKDFRVNDLIPVTNLLKVV